MSAHRNRQPKGTPVGGQYAAGNRAGADASLLLDGAPADDPWEQVDTSLAERARQTGTAGWQDAGAGYVDETVRAYGPNRPSGRMAAVFPSQDGWRYNITDKMPGTLVRQEIATGDVDTFEEAVGLAERNLGWGEVNLAEGSRTPWGPAQHVQPVAPGIARVDTAGHGGVKLSPERNKMIPAALRSGSGWYEEDCEACIPQLVFPDELRAKPQTGYQVEQTPEDAKEDARVSVRTWFPDGYEKATGETVEPGQSHVRDRDRWTKAHENDWVSRSASYSKDRPGMVEVTATRAGETKRFYVSKDTYEQERAVGELGANGRMRIEPATFDEIPEEPKPPKTPTQRYTEVRLDGLTDAQRSKVNKDLAQRYRDDNGAVRSVGQLIAVGEVSGKTVHVENGRRTYSLSQKEFEEDSSYSVLPVSKTTWDAFQGHDTRSALQAAQQDVEYAQYQVDRLGGSVWARRAPETKRALERLNAAKVRLDEARGQGTGR